MIEPDAWMLTDPHSREQRLTGDRRRMQNAQAKGLKATPLYAHPPAPTLTDAERVEVAEILALAEKATPGEWRYQKHEGGSNGDMPWDDHDIQVLCDFEKYTGGCWWNITTVQHDQSGPKQDDEVNARFIAAAPRMAAIIKRLVAGAL